MEKKMLLQELADFIATKEDISKKEAEAFCRFFFEVIEEGLINDKYVKIKGFGTFKLVPIGERESIDVNTGERIQISGHSKISFIPDTFIKGLVNRPFAHFQTVTINDETNMEELENVTVLDEDWSDEENGDINETETSPVHNLVEENAPLPTEDEAEKEVEDIQEPSNETKASSAVSKEDAGISDEENQEAVLESPLAEEQAEAASSDISASERYEDEHDASLSARDENLNAQPTTLPDDAQPIRSAEELTENAAVSNDEQQHSSVSGLSSIKGPIKYVMKATHNMRTPNWWKVIAITLFLIILVTLSYFAGYYKVFCPPCDVNNADVMEKNVPAQPVADKALSDSLTKAKEPTKDAQRDSLPSSQKLPMPSSPQKENNNEADLEVKEQMVYSPAISYEIIGTKSTHKVKRGENLYGIAQKVYGHKQFASYIVRYNKLKNPDNIVLGSTLKLPELKPKKK